MSTYNEALHPRQASGRFAVKTNSAPTDRLITVADIPGFGVRWDGSADVMIASRTNPWLQDSDGNGIDLTGGRATRSEQSALDGDCECFDGPVPGALVGMDSPEGIQRCDMCQRFDGDLAAAQAVAAAYTSDTGRPVSVWFTPQADPSTGRVSRRADGRLEVADERGANEAYGCSIDDWCVLVDGHDGDCNEDREHWEGPDVLYPPEKTPAEHLAEYELPRPEDIVEAEAQTQAQASLHPVTPERVAINARVLAELRAPERMWVDGVPHPGDDIFESIWTTDAGGQGEATCRLELDALVKLRSDLAAGRIRPRDVIGTGYRGDTRKLANEWIDRQKAQFDRALEVRGRNLPVNASNVRYRLRKAGLLAG
ncbi:MULTISPECIES: hypothetical protein [Microbacterium]|nr:MULTISPECIES: hypothetical protein [Microbacterium]EPD84062.1 hypothetical protein HMPREF1529_02102 [Microbacterium sp. oral taxon 186 str. F0373]